MRKTKIVHPILRKPMILHFAKQRSNGASKNAASRAMSDERPMMIIEFEVGVRIYVVESSAKRKDCAQ